MANYLELLKKRNNKLKRTGGRATDRRNGSRNQLAYRDTNEDTLDRLKYEIANEIGVDLGPETTARANGTVGGLMVRSMIRYAQKNIDDMFRDITDEEWEAITLDEEDYVVY